MEHRSRVVEVEAVDLADASSVDWMADSTDDVGGGEVGQLIDVRRAWARAVVVEEAAEVHPS